MLRPCSQILQRLCSAACSSSYELLSSCTRAASASGAASGALECSTSSSCSYSTAPASPRGPPPARAAPWTPTAQLTKRKTYQKRMRHLIQVLEAEHVQRVHESRPVPDFRAGDILEVQVAVPENDRKVYTYKGVCLGRLNKGPRTWFKLYNVFQDAGGFVQHFPLYMPDLLSVKVLGRLPRARRARLYHLLEDESKTHMYQPTVVAPKT